MIKTVLKTYFNKQNPKLILYQKYKNYNNLLFQQDSQKIYYQMKESERFSRFWFPNLEFSCSVEDKICSCKSSNFHE